MPNANLLKNAQAQDMMIGRRDNSQSNQVAYLNKSMMPTTDTHGYQTEAKDSITNSRFVNQLFKSSVNNPTNIPILPNSLLIRSHRPQITKISEQGNQPLLSKPQHQPDQALNPRTRHQQRADQQFLLPPKSNAVFQKRRRGQHHNDQLLTSQLRVRQAQ